MSTDRKRLLEDRATAARAVADPNLSDRTRGLAKVALDKADVALGLQDAMARRAERERGQVSG